MILSRNFFRISPLSDALWFQAATTEIFLRDADNANTFSKLRSELSLCCLHAEGQSDEFQQSETELRQHLERSKTEGAQVRNFYEETRTANASIAPKATRLRARELQLVTEVATLRHEETELQGQLQNLHDVKHRHQSVIYTEKRDADNLRNMSGKKTFGGWPSLKDQPSENLGIQERAKAVKQLEF